MEKEIKAGHMTQVRSTKEKDLGFPSALCAQGKE